MVSFGVEGNGNRKEAAIEGIDKMIKLSKENGQKDCLSGMK